jgi:hypothetical protein
LTGFGRRFFGAVAGEPCASESNPVKQRLRVTRSPHQEPPFPTAMA